MNNPRFIHLLLVAVMLCGQISANAHMVEHFHEQLSDSIAQPTACDKTHGFAGSFSSVHKHDCTVAHDTEHNAEYDCGIYHAFLSLGGILCTAPDQAYAPLTQFVSAGYTPSNHSKTAVQTAQIRAPPKHS